MYLVLRPGKRSLFGLERVEMWGGGGLGGVFWMLSYALQK